MISMYSQASCMETAGTFSNLKRGLYTSNPKTVTISEAIKDIENSVPTVSLCPCSLLAPLN